MIGRHFKEDKPPQITYYEGKIKKEKEQSLLKENEQLKKKLQIYKSDGLETLNDLQRCQENIEKCVEKIEALEKENNQLKAVNKTLCFNLRQENERLKAKIRKQKQIIDKQEMKLAEYNNQK